MAEAIEIGNGIHTKILSVFKLVYDLVIQQKSVTVTPSGTAKKCHCKRMAYTVSL